MEAPPTPPMSRQTLRSPQGVPGQSPPGRGGEPRQGRAAPPTASSSLSGRQLGLALALPRAARHGAARPPSRRPSRRSSRGTGDTRARLPLLWQRLGSDRRSSRKHKVPRALHSPAPGQLPQGFARASGRSFRSAGNTNRCGG